MAQAGVPLEVTSVYRSPTAQARLYRYASNPETEHPFPVAPPDCSCATHTRGLSWDMIGPLGELRRLGMLWRSWGGIWGDEQDPIHFQGTPYMLANRPTMPQDRRSWLEGRGVRRFVT